MDVGMDGATPDGGGHWKRNFGSKKTYAKKSNVWELAVKERVAKALSKESKNAFPER